MRSVVYGGIRGAGAVLLGGIAASAWAQAAGGSGEIVVAVRYLLPDATSHAHLFLYREDGRMLRQLTRDNSGQDRSPVFAPDGETIIFTRDKGKTHEYWQVTPRGEKLTRLAKAPTWYKPAQTQDVNTYSSPYFTNRDASATPDCFGTPDGSAEVAFRETKSNVEDEADNGASYVLRDVKTGRATPFGKLHGFEAVDSLLEETKSHARFIWEPGLHVAFWEHHLNSTDGDTVYALDFAHPRFVRLSPNWAAPFVLPGQSAFLTLTDVRYVPIAGSQKTANCSYVEHWDSRLHRIRYAHPGAALCYGASLYRPGRAPSIVTIPDFD